MFVSITSSASSFWYDRVHGVQRASTATHRTCSNPFPAPGGTPRCPASCWRSPPGRLALQSRRSNADTVLSQLAVYRVSFAGVDLRRRFGPIGSPVEHGRAWRIPTGTVALQVFASNTVQPFSAPIVVTYTVWVAWSTSTSCGSAADVDGRGRLWSGSRPDRSRCRSRCRSSRRCWSVAAAQLAMYTVWLAGSAKMPERRRRRPGPSPASARSPRCSSALQVAPLNTETVLSPTLVTYTVSVCSSIGDRRSGRFPTVIVGHGPLQRETSWARQWRVSITETVFPADRVAVVVVAVGDVDRVGRRRSSASATGPLPTGADPTSADPKPSPPRRSNAAANPRCFPSLAWEPK